MASELSRYIEQELERKGIDPDDDRKNLLGRETFRVESRAQAQDNQRKASKATRNFCVGGGIFLALVLIIYFLSKSKAPSGTQVDLTGDRKDDSGNKSQPSAASGEATNPETGTGTTADTDTGGDKPPPENSPEGKSGEKTDTAEGEGNAAGKGSSTEDTEGGAGGPENQDGGGGVAGDTPADKATEVGTVDNPKPGAAKEDPPPTESLSPPETLPALSMTPNPDSTASSPPTEPKTSSKKVQGKKGNKPNPDSGRRLLRTPS